jgi:antitoxin component of MazEF toxin-antitoxin module
MCYMRARIRKSGHSYVITIPPIELEASGCKAGDMVHVDFHRADHTVEMPAALAEMPEVDSAKQIASRRGYFAARMAE